MQRWVILIKKEHTILNEEVKQFGNMLSGGGYCIHGKCINHEPNWKLVNVKLIKANGFKYRLWPAKKCCNTRTIKTISFASFVCSVCENRFDTNVSRIDFCECCKDKIWRYLINYDIMGLTITDKDYYNKVAKISNVG